MKAKGFSAAGYHGPKTRGSNPMVSCGTTAIMGSGRGILHILLTFYRIKSHIITRAKFIC
jgi:hypothetical protein